MMQWNLIQLNKTTLQVSNTNNKMLHNIPYVLFKFCKTLTIYMLVITYYKKILLQKNVYKKKIWEKESGWLFSLSDSLSG